MGGSCKNSFKVIQNPCPVHGGTYDDWTRSWSLHQNQWDLSFLELLYKNCKDATQNYFIYFPSGSCIWVGIQYEGPCLHAKCVSGNVFKLNTFSTVFKIMKILIRYLPWTRYLLSHYLECSSGKDHNCISKRVYLYFWYNSADSDCSLIEIETQIINTNWQCWINQVI